MYSKWLQFSTVSSPSPHCLFQSWTLCRWPHSRHHVLVSDDFLLLALWPWYHPLILGTSQLVYQYLKRIFIKFIHTEKVLWVVRIFLSFLTVSNELHYHKGMGRLLPGMATRLAFNVPGSAGAAGREPSMEIVCWELVREMALGDFLFFWSAFWMVAESVGRLASWWKTLRLRMMAYTKLQLPEV